MQKIILCLAAFALIPAVYVAVADAQDYEDFEFIEEDAEVRDVAKRMNCDDIKKEIDRLNTLDALDDVQSGELAKFKSDYRSKCTKRSASRSKARVKVIVDGASQIATENESVTTETSEDVGEINKTCDNPDSNGCCPGETYTDMGDLGFNCCTENNEHCFPPIKEEKKVSVCDDGTNPDGNGCCTGETYTDMGDLGFNCCTENNEHCFPPIR